VVAEMPRIQNSVLRVGECGTGKQICSLQIHQLSGRPGPSVMENLVRWEWSYVSASRVWMRARDDTGANTGTAFFDE